MGMGTEVKYNMGMGTEVSNCYNIWELGQRIPMVTIMAMGTREIQECSFYGFRTSRQRNVEP